MKLSGALLLAALLGGAFLASSLSKHPSAAAESAADPLTPAPAPAAAQPSRTAALEPGRAKVDAPGNVTTEPESPQSPSSAARVATAEVQAPLGQGQNFYQMLDATTTEQSARGLVKEKRISDFASTLGSGTQISPDALFPYTGYYSGDILFDEPGRPAWTLMLNLTGSASSGNFQGRYEISVRSEGQLLAQAQGNDTLPAFTTVANDPKAIIMEIVKGKGYVQVYPSSGLDALVGNYYTLSSAPGAGFINQGTVVMRKQSQPNPW